jgi:hypothetical protein
MWFKYFIVDDQISYSDKLADDWELSGISLKEVIIN